VEVNSLWGVAVRDDGLTYFTQLFENGVGITSTTTRTIDGFVMTGFIPTGIAFSPDGNTIYVGNQDATVSVIDVATREPIATYDTEGTPIFAVQVSPRGRRALRRRGGARRSTRSMPQPARSSTG
jgi:YVTN family beta-propeller protein